MANRRKTISVSKIVNKANFDLWRQSIIHKTPKIARDNFENIKYILLDNDVYGGYNTIDSTEDFERRIREYLSTVDACIVTENEIQDMLSYHRTVKQRIIDKWYVETGNCYDGDVMTSEGHIKAEGKYREWMSYSHNEFEKENFIFLY